MMSLPPSAAAYEQAANFAGVQGASLPAVDGVNAARSRMNAQPFPTDKDIAFTP